MASASTMGSVRSWSWTNIIQAVYEAGKSIIRSLKIKLTLLDPDSPEDEVNPLDIYHLMYHFNKKLEKLPSNQRRTIKAILATIFSACTYSLYHFLITTGGDRWVLNPLISDFQFPILPDHAKKVFLFCKYSFAICLVYNMMKYAVDRKDEMVAMMDELEIDAAMEHPGQSPEARLDASVPRPGDSAKKREARELLSMRRLLRRGVFVFDVVPEPEHVEEPKPTKQQMQIVREVMELEAVKKLNDPRILREYIRRRESRQGRQQVHLYRMREKKKKARSKALKVESSIEIKQEDDSSGSQLKQWKTTPKTDVPSLGLTKLTSLKDDEEEGEENFSLDFHDLFPSPSATTQGLVELLPCLGKHTGHKDKRPASASPPRAAPLQAAKWPVSGTCRPARSQRDYSPTNRRRGSSEGSDLEPTYASIFQPSEYSTRRSSDSSSPPLMTPPPRSNGAKPRHSDLLTRPKGPMSRRPETPSSTAAPFASKTSPLAARLLEKRRPTTAGDGKVQDKECPQPAQSAKGRSMTWNTSPKSPANARGRTCSSTPSPSPTRRPTVTHGTRAGIGSAPGAGDTTGSGNVSGTDGSPDRRQTLAETIYTAWRNKALSKRLKEGGSYKYSQDTTPQSRVKPKSNERRPSAVRGSRDAVDRTAEGDQVQKLERHPEQREARSEYKSARSSEPRPEQKTVQQSDVRFEYQPERRSQYQSDKHLEPIIEKGSESPGDKLSETHSEPSIGAHFERRSEKHEKYSDRQPTKYAEHRAEEYSNLRVDEHPEPRTKKSSEHRTKKGSESLAKGHSGHRAEKLSERTVEGHSVHQIEKHVEQRPERHSDQRLKKLSEGRVDGNSANQIDKHIEQRPERHSDHRPEKLTEGRLGGHSANQIEKHVEQRPERRSDHRVERLAEVRVGGRSEHQVEKREEQRPERHSDQRLKKLSEGRVEGDSANQIDKHVEQRPERHSDHRVEKLTEGRVGGHSEHQVEKRVEQRPERHSDHRPEKLTEGRVGGHSANQIEKHVEQRPERRSDHRVERLTEGRVGGHSEHQVEKRVEQRPERHSDHRVEKLTEGRVGGHSAHHVEKHVEQRPERHSDQRLKKLSEGRVEGHCSNQIEKNVEQRPERHSDHRPEKLTEGRVGGHSAHQVEKHVEQRPEKYSDQQLKKLSEGRIEGRSAHQVEKHVEQIPERHSDHRPEKLHDPHQIEKHSDRREENVAGSRTERIGYQQTEGANHPTDEFAHRSDGMHERRHPEKGSEDTSKELKEVLAEHDPVSDAPTYSDPMSDAKETSDQETRRTETGDTTVTGSDTLTYQFGKTENISVVEAKPKPYLQISNLLEPRGDWSDSASSLSDTSPSVTSTIRVLTDSVVSEEPADSLESH